MNQNEAKSRFYELAAEFFTGAEIRWAETIGTKPRLPYLTLRAGPISRTAFPREDEDGNMVYDCSTTMEVNLYTKGAPVTVADGVTGNYENTATSDLSDFALFIESEATVDKVAGWGMDVLQKESVKDITELQNDTAYQYRAMAEFTVNYARAANGLYGVSDMPAHRNSSGGGAEELLADIPPVEEVALEEQ